MENEIDELSHGWVAVELPRRRWDGRRWCRGPNNEERFTRPDQTERAPRGLFQRGRVLRQPLTLLLQTPILQPEPHDDGLELGLFRVVPNSGQVTVIADDGIDDEHAQSERKPEGQAAATPIARILGAAKAAPGSASGRSLVVTRGIN